MCILPPQMFSQTTFIRLFVYVFSEIELSSSKVLMPIFIIITNFGAPRVPFFFSSVPTWLVKKKKKKKSSKLVRWYATIQHVSVDVTLRSSESEVAFSGTFLEWTPCKTFLTCRTDVKKMKQELLQKLFFMSFKSSDNKLFWHHLNVCN